MKKSKQGERDVGKKIEVDVAWRPAASKGRNDGNSVKTRVKGQIYK